MTEEIRISIVEDNAAFSRSLQRLIALTEGMVCVGSYESAEACHDDLLNSKQVSDLFLLDLNLPGMSGIAMIPELTKILPETKILVITQDDNYLTTLDAIYAGVHGYILKTASTHSIAQCIREVIDGGCIIDPKLSRFVLDALTGANEVNDGPLSDREIEVLELLAKGYVKREVSNALNVTYSTVAKHTESIYRKLAVSNVTAAVAIAIRRGII